MTDCMKLAGYASGGREYRASRQANACEMANMELQRKICSRNDKHGLGEIILVTYSPKIGERLQLAEKLLRQAKFPSAYITSVESDRGQSLTQLDKVNSPALQPRTKQIRKWRQGALANRAHERGRFHTPPPLFPKLRLGAAYESKLDMP
ncbi:hypothetical protein L211DRAFT_867803 [Terfezia boudieri ATCC MYA-4762]|uniref:Uncharacterized protein n=1 Tax=Terfezia boudieri ATCC MYA-4762 TaxID=1051890 RepID=A0A3N4M2C5_9PEZI|nr:hypothetical protein L211DRAFT_867803 [Terfezia boudieri ATCC MYA-4762]